MSDVCDAVIRLDARAAEDMFAQAALSVDGLEVGGLLLGHDIGTHIRVTVAGDPGPCARREPDWFLRDLAHARRLGDLAYAADGSVWLGEWHTHPRGPGQPSGTDLDTYRALLDDPDLGFERVVAIVVSGPLAPIPGLRALGWVFDDTGLHRASIVRNDSCRWGAPDTDEICGGSSCLPTEPGGTDA